MRTQVRPSTCCHIVLTLHARAHCQGLACRLQTGAAGARPQTIRNLATTLVPGLGRVYLRDYGRGDLAGERLRRVGRARRLERGAYCRSDGTRTYFFSEVRSRVGTPATLMVVSCCGSAPG